MRMIKLVGDEIFDRRTADVVLEPTGLFVEPPEGGKLFLPG
jgi:hypothetical protein